MDPGGKVVLGPQLEALRVSRDMALYHDIFTESPSDFDNATETGGTHSINPYASIDAPPLSVHYRGWPWETNGIENCNRQEAR